MARGATRCSAAATHTSRASDQLGKGIFYYEQKLNERFLGVVT